MSWVKEGTGSYFSQFGWGGKGVEDICTPIAYWVVVYAIRTINTVKKTGKIWK
jgi:hypothetical protein